MFNVQWRAGKRARGYWIDYRCGGRDAVSDLTGKPAIPFRLRDVHGRTHTLEDYRGDWLLMVFHRHLG